MLALWRYAGQQRVGEIDGAPGGRCRRPDRLIYWADRTKPNGVFSSSPPPKTAADPAGPRRMAGVAAAGKKICAAPRSHPRFSPLCASRPRQSADAARKPSIPTRRPITAQAARKKADPLPSRSRSSVCPASCRHGGEAGQRTAGCFPWANRMQAASSGSNASTGMPRDGSKLANVIACWMPRWGELGRPHPNHQLAPDTSERYDGLAQARLDIERRREDGRDAAIGILMASPSVSAARLDDTRN